MRSIFRRALGQILVDGKFLSRRTLDRALVKQKQSNELLGAVLVRMGVLSPADIGVPLMLQGHLSRMEDAVKLAAGQRQLLGALLVQTGQITASQLDQATAEQHKSGEKLGEIFVRLGMLTEQQLKGLLDLQQNQASPASNPLRLGELLIATGCITRQQLERALARQGQTGKRIGELLVCDGIVRKSQIRSVVRLQRLCVNSVLAAILTLGMAGAAAASSVALTWDPSPDSDVAGYKIHYQADSDAQPFQGPEPVDVQNATSATIDNLDPSHAYSFAVTAYDVGGTESVYSNIVTIAEAQPPITSITSPEAGTTVGGMVTVTADTADNVGVREVEFYVDGVLKTVMTAAPYSYSWDTAPLAPGTYTLQTRAYDAAGNVGQSQAVTVTVKKDLLVPTVSLTSPENNTTVSGTVSVSAVAADNVGVSRVAFYLNGTLQNLTNVTPYGYRLDTTKLVNGIHTLAARAYDAAGNEGQSQVITVNVYNDLEAPTITLTSPGANSTVSGTVEITVDAADNLGVSRVEFYKNGVLMASTGSSPYSYSWDTRPVPSGSYTIAAKAYDAFGNAGQSQSVTVTVSNDLAPPSVSLTSPGPGATVQGTTTVSASASDNSAVAKVEFYRDGALAATATKAPYSWNWDTRSSSNGSHTVTAKAYDASGNVGVSQSVTVKVSNDVVAPSVTLTSPARSMTVSGTIVLAATATDDVAVKSVSFYRDGTLIYTSGTAPYRFRWNTGTVPNGSYLLTARATDAAGNVGQSKSVTVTVRNR